MRKVILVLLLVLPGCIDSDNDNVTTVWAVDNSGTGVSSSGGAIIQYSSLTVPAFVFGEPMPFLEELPEPDRLAVAEAESLVPPETLVIDALRTAHGLLALVREPGGVVLTILSAEPELRALAPEDARRLLPFADDPLQVLVVLPDDRAVPATRTFGD